MGEGDVLEYCTCLLDAGILVVGELIGVDWVLFFFCLFLPFNRAGSGNSWVVEDHCILLQFPMLILKCNTVIPIHYCCGITNSK